MQAFRTLVLFLLIASVAHAQSPMPELAQIKIAAEAGNAEAQLKYGNEFTRRVDNSNAKFWFRKAALQGNIEAQDKLGHCLLVQRDYALISKPALQAAAGSEALKWISLAASQNNHHAQSTLAEFFLKGRMVHQDYVEAYKWGELASQGLPTEASHYSGLATREAAILKMSAAQIEDARQRVTKFVPIKPKASEVAEPAWLSELQLTGISGKADARLAIINNRTFGTGDTISLKLGGNPVTVHCVEVHESSVIISLAGIEGTQELKMK